METLKFNYNMDTPATPYASDTLIGGKTVSITFPDGKKSAIFVQSSLDGETWSSKQSISPTGTATFNISADATTYLRILVAVRPASASWQDYSSGSGSGSGGGGPEVDPTVPSWAKQPKKPTYTASEVGAPTTQQFNTLSVQVTDNTDNIDLALQGNLKVAGDIRGMQSELSELSLKVKELKVADATVENDVLTITKTDGSRIEFEGGGEGGDSSTSVIDTTNGDFEVADENGNVIFQVANGHVYTKSFDSSDIKTDPYAACKNYGKSVGVFGGSFSAIPESEGAKELWRRLLKMEVTTYGVSGQGFSYGGNNMMTQVDSAGVHDIYILWASTNDYRNMTRVGTIDDTDVNTLCGAINYCIQKLFEKNPKCEVYLFTPLRYFDENYGEVGWNPYTEDTAYGNGSFYDYSRYMVKCAEKWGVPVFDQFMKGGFTRQNFKQYFQADNLHPNVKGYNLVGYKQVEFLKNGI